MNLRDLDPDDFMFPYCPKCDDHVMLLTRMRKRGAAYVNVYHCQECKHIGVKADWRKPK